jgi:hypothetical protein
LLHDSSLSSGEPVTDADWIALESMSDGMLLMIFPIMMNRE